MSTVELLNKGMRCLQRDLGIVETEEFITAIKREKFDYTEWRHNLFEGMTLEKLNEDAIAYEREHPFQGKKAVRL